MRKRAWVPMIVAAACLMVLSIGVEAQLGKKRDPSWAFQVIDPCSHRLRQSRNPFASPGAPRPIRTQTSRICRPRRTGSLKRMPRSPISCCAGAGPCLPAAHVT